MKCACPQVFHGEVSKGPKDPDIRTEVDTYFQHNFINQTNKVSQHYNSHSHPSHIWFFFFPAIFNFFLALFLDSNLLMMFPKYDRLRLIIFASRERAQA